jgi:N6-adenosine-specific RNA methylase IME4
LALQNVRARLDTIKLGERHRKDLGDLKSLAGSIADVGLLHPVVVTPDNTLIAGERRLAAVKLLGWADIPITIVDLDEIVRGEFAENAIRKDFLPSEIEAIRQALAPKVATPEGRPATKTKETFLSLDRGQTRDKIGAFAGISGRTVEKIAAVCDAAKKLPEKFAKLVAEMDRTGKVDGAYRKLKQAFDEQRILSVKPIVGKHKTLVIDPPWDHQGFSLAGRGRPQYNVMSQEELLRMPVASWAEDNCHLYLWATNNFLLRAGELVSAWGFEYKTVLTWVKPKIGLGSYFRSSTEQCLFSVRGKLTTRVNDIPTHFLAPVGEHSAKPDEFYDIVQRASYPPYGEAFQREPRDDFINLFISSEKAA